MYGMYRGDQSTGTVGLFLTSDSSAAQKARVWSWGEPPSQLFGYDWCDLWKIKNIILVFRNILMSFIQHLITGWVKKYGEFIFFEKLQTKPPITHGYLKLQTLQFYHLQYM